MYVPNGGHSRHAKQQDQGQYRLVRSAKHRYVFFCTFDKRRKKQWREALRYPVLPYPKGDNNPDYTLGEFIKPVIVSKETGLPVSVPSTDEEQISIF